MLSDARGSLLQRARLCTQVGRSGVLERERQEGENEFWRTLSINPCEHQRDQNATLKEPGLQFLLCADLEAAFCRHLYSACTWSESVCREEMVVETCHL